LGCPRMALRFANFGWSGTALNAIRPCPCLSFSLCPLFHVASASQPCGNNAWLCRRPGH
jgi:hypothetical protein